MQIIDTRLFDFDPLSGVKSLFHYREDDSFIIEKVMDVEPILDVNKAKAIETAGSWKGDMHHVASIPMIVYNDLVQQGIIDPVNDPEATRLRAWLNDPDNRLFRTKPWRL